MKRTLLLLLCYFVSGILKGQTTELSPRAEIYLLTISPGQELYSSFGHSTILIEDYEKGLSEMYNYGSFDFNTDNFYIKFLRGTLPYQLTKNDLQLALRYWTEENRIVTKQKLRMSLSNKQKIYDLLEENYQPENRTYQYKFFYDNCSTRIRDLFVNVLGDSISFNQNLNADQSYRDWIETYAAHKAIADFGMDIAIGIPADEITGYKGAMYIPDNLMFALDSAKVLVDNNTQSFVVNKEVINSMYVSRTSPKKEINIPLILSVLLFLRSVYYAVNKNRNNVFRIGVGNKILFTTAGISGVILTLLWFFTDHGVTAYNLNVLWANPLYLFLFWKAETKNYRLFLYAAVASILVVLIDVFQIQDIPLAADVLAVSLAIRLFTFFKQKNGTS